MKKPIVLLLLALSSIAHAQQAGTALLTWTNATYNTDTSEIVSDGDGALAYTTINYSLCVNGDIDSANIKSHYVSANRTSTTVSTEGPIGDYCFRGTHTNSYGQTSDLSSIAVKTVATAGQPRTPVTPTALTVLATTDPTVYTIIRQENKFVLLPVGTVPANTACDGSQKINDHYVVDRNLVTWSGTVKPAVVVAQCS